MKIILSFLATVFLCGFAVGREQSNLFRLSYEERGERFVEALYWLPETREVFREKLPKKEQWVGFEQGWWNEIPRESKLEILDDLAAQWDELDSDAKNLAWKRIYRWELIASQLKLMISYTQNEEDFYDWAFGDPLLHPSFDWIIGRRPKNFDTKHIGGSFASGEAIAFRAVLIERLVDSTEKEQAACFSRFFAHLSQDLPE